MLLIDGPWGFEFNADYWQPLSYETLFKARRAEHRTAQENAEWAAKMSALETKQREWAKDKPDRFGKDDTGKKVFDVGSPPIVRPDLEQVGVGGNKRHKIVYGSIPYGAAFWVTAKEGPMAGRKVLLVKRPDERVALVGEGGQLQVAEGEQAMPDTADSEGLSKEEKEFAKQEAQEQEEQRGKEAQEFAAAAKHHAFAPTSSMVAKEEQEEPEDEERAALMREQEALRDEKRELRNAVKKADRRARKVVADSYDDVVEAYGFDPEKAFALDKEQQQAIMEGVGNQLSNAGVSAPVVNRYTRELAKLLKDSRSELLKPAVRALREATRLRNRAEDNLDRFKRMVGPERAEKVWNAHLARVEARKRKQDEWVASQSRRNRKYFKDNPEKVSDAFKAYEKEQVQKRREEAAAEREAAGEAPLDESDLDRVAHEREGVPYLSDDDIGIIHAMHDLQSESNRAALMEEHYGERDFFVPVGVDAGTIEQLRPDEDGNDPSGPLAQQVAIMNMRRALSESEAVGGVKPASATDEQMYTDIGPKKEKKPLSSQQINKRIKKYLATMSAKDKAIERGKDRLKDLETTKALQEAEAHADSIQDEIRDDADRLSEEMDFMREHRATERDLDKRLREINQDIQHLSDFSVAQMSMRGLTGISEEDLNNTITDHELQVLRENLDDLAYTPFNGPGTGNIYTAVGELTRESRGGQNRWMRAQEHVSSGAMSAVAGLVETAMPERLQFMVEAMPKMRTFGVEAGVYAIAAQIHALVDDPAVDFSRDDLKDFIRRVGEYNAANQPFQEAVAMDYHDQLVEQQAQLEDQIASGAIADPEAASHDEIKQFLVASRSRSAILSDMETNLGLALGSLWSSGSLYYALRAMDKSTGHVHLSVGGTGLTAPEQKDLAKRTAKMMGVASVATVKVDSSSRGDSPAVLRIPIKHLRKSMRLTPQQREAYKAGYMDPEKFKLDDKNLDEKDFDTTGYLPHAFKDSFTPEGSKDEIRTRLRGPQRQDIQWGVAKIHNGGGYGGGLITRTTASGKTLSAIAIIHEIIARYHGHRSIIVVPPNAVNQWMDESGRFTHAHQIRPEEGESKAKYLSRVKKEAVRIEKENAKRIEQGLDPIPVAISVDEGLMSTKDDRRALYYRTKKLGNAYFVMNHHQAASDTTKGKGEKSLVESYHAGGGCVIDEPQMLKSAGAQGFVRKRDEETGKITYRPPEPSGKPSAALKRLRAIHFKTKFALTATPARDNLTELYDNVLWCIKKPQFTEEGELRRNKAGRIMYHTSPIGSRANFNRLVGMVGKGTNAQFDGVTQYLQRQVAQHVSGDRLKKLPFKVNLTEQGVTMSDRQLSRQKEIDEEAVSGNQYEKMLSRAHGEVSKLNAKAKAREAALRAEAEDKGESYVPKKTRRKGAQHRAIDRFAKELSRRHKANLSGTGEFNNPKIKAVIHNLNQFKEGLRPRGEGGSWVSDPRHAQALGHSEAAWGKHIIIVDGLDQRRALMKGLAREGLSYVDMTKQDKRARNQMTGSERSIYDRAGGDDNPKEAMAAVLNDRKARWRDHTNPESPSVIILDGPDHTGYLGSVTGHNLQEADQIHVVGVPGDAASLFQGHGRGARAPRKSYEGTDENVPLDIVRYKFTDSPHAHQEERELWSQSQIVGMSSPGAVAYAEPQEVEKSLRRILVTWFGEYDA